MLSIPPSTTDLRIQQEVSIPHICVSVTQMFDVRAFLLKCASITLLDNKIFTRPAAYTLPFAFILGRFERMFTSITNVQCARLYSNANLYNCLITNLRARSSTYLWICCHSQMLRDRSSRREVVLYCRLRVLTRGDLLRKERLKISSHRHSRARGCSRTTPQGLPCASYRTVLDVEIGRKETSHARETLKQFDW